HLAIADIVIEALSERGINVLWSNKVGRPVAVVIKDVSNEKARLQQPLAATDISYPRRGTKSPPRDVRIEMSACAIFESRQAVLRSCGRHGVKDTTINPLTECNVSNRFERRGSLAPMGLPRGKGFGGSDPFPVDMSRGCGLLAHLVLPFYDERPVPELALRHIATAEVLEPVHAHGSRPTGPSRLTLNRYSP